MITPDSVGNKGLWR